MQTHIYMDERLYLYVYVYVYVCIYAYYAGALSPSVVAPSSDGHVIVKVQAGN